MPSPVAVTRTFGPLTEATTHRYRAQLLDETGTAVPGSLVQAATLTLYLDKATADIINGRNGQDVLQTNGVTIDEDGWLEWTITPADTVIVDTTLATERRVALFHLQWGGDKALWHEVVLPVRNLRKVPPA